MPDGKVDLEYSRTEEGRATRREGASCREKQSISRQLVAVVTLLQQRPQLPQRQWFTQNDLRPKLICLSLKLTSVLGGNHHDQHLWVLSAYLGKHFHAIAVRQAKIKEHNTHRITVQDGPGILSRCRPEGDKTVSLQALDKIVSEDELVIDDQNGITHKRIPLQVSGQWFVRRLRTARVTFYRVMVLGSPKENVGVLLSRYLVSLHRLYSLASHEKRARQMPCITAVSNMDGYGVQFSQCSSLPPLWGVPCGSYQRDGSLAVGLFPLRGLL